MDKPLRVLLVEDNAVNRVVAQRMLGLLGYTPDVVTDGEAAVRVCRENEYDVILMDLEMPTLDGISATRRLRAEPLRKQPWIIALTADALIGDREKCLAAGMNDYVTKPIVMAALEGAFQRCAEGATGASSNTRGTVVAG
jgi:CheY-like chemotaxis protein